MQENEHSRRKQIGPDKPERVQDAAPPAPFTPEQDWTLRRRFESYCTGTSSQAFIAEFRRRKQRSQGRYYAAADFTGDGHGRVVPLPVASPSPLLNDSPASRLTHPFNCLIGGTSAITSWARATALVPSA
jgi:hypothetical protein